MLEFALYLGLCATLQAETCRPFYHQVVSVESEEQCRSYGNALISGLAHLRTPERPYMAVACIELAKET